MFKGFSWNIPNALTLFRLAGVVLCVLPLLPLGTLSSVRVAISLIFFTLSAVSDFFDGWFARRLNQTSEWGAYMDPLIDKVLIWALYGALLAIPFLHIPFWAVALIVLRDVTVTFLRNAAAQRGIPFKTSFLAKSKTAVQMVAGVFILCYVWVTLSVVEFHAIGNPERMWANVPAIKQIPSQLAAGISLFTLLTLFDYLIAFARARRQA